MGQISSLCKHAELRTLQNGAEGVVLTADGEKSKSQKSTKVQFLLVTLTYLQQRNYRHKTAVHHTSSSSVLATSMLVLCGRHQGSACGDWEWVMGTQSVTLAHYILLTGGTEDACVIVTALRLLHYILGGTVLKSSSSSTLTYTSTCFFNLNSLCSSAPAQGLLQ